MPMTFVQSPNPTLKLLNNVTSVTTNPINFASNTSVSDLLIGICCANSASGTNPPPVPTIATPVTTGFTWVLAAAATTTDAQVYSHTGAFYTAAIAIYYIANSAAMGTGVTTTVTATAPASVADLTVTCNLAEFSVVSVKDITATATGLNGTPGVGNVTTNFTDLLLFGESDSNGGGAFPPTGFTRFPTFADGLSLLGYKLNVAPGTYNLTSGTTLTTNWAAFGVAFGPAANKQATPVFSPPAGTYGV